MIILVLFRFNIMFKQLYNYMNPRCDVFSQRQKCTNMEWLSLKELRFVLISVEVYCMTYCTWIQYVMLWDVQLSYVVFLQGNMDWLSKEGWGARSTKTDRALSRGRRKKQALTWYAPSNHCIVLWNLQPGSVRNSGERSTDGVKK